MYIYIFVLWISEGFDSGIILIVRGGTLMSVGHFPEMLSQRILVGIILMILIIITVIRLLILRLIRILILILI